MSVHLFSTPVTKNMSVHLFSTPVQKKMSLHLFSTPVPKNMSVHLFSTPVPTIDNSIYKYTVYAYIYNTEKGTDILTSIQTDRQNTA